MKPHCWKDKHEWVAERFGWGSPEYWESFGKEEDDATCMLAAGHDGDHDWMPDGCIGVTFPSAQPTGETPPTRGDRGEEPGG